MAKRILFYSIFGLGCVLCYSWIKQREEVQGQTEAPTVDRTADGLKGWKRTLEDKAVGLFRVGKHEECIAYVDTELAKLEEAAREEGKELRHFPAMREDYHYHNLDAAGSLLRIKAMSLGALGKYPEQVRVWEQMVRDFPYAQNWRNYPKVFRTVFEARGYWQAYKLNQAIRVDKDLPHYVYVRDSIFDDGADRWCSSTVAGNLFKREDFDSLDYACDFMVTDPKWQTPTKSWLINALYHQAAPNADENEKVWQARRALLDKWIASRPQSKAAPLMLVEYLIKYGWKARGSGWSNTVTEEGWRKLADRIREAHTLLDKIPRDNPQWYTSRITVAMAEGEDGEATWAICREGVQKFPWYLPLMTAYQQYLLPRWHGKPGEWQDFALRMGKEVGPIAYFHLIQTGAGWENFEGEVRSKTTDWEMLKKGVEEWAALEPRDPWPLQQLTGYAWQRKDKPTAKRLFGLISNIPHPSVWQTVEGFDDVKRWALK